MNNENLTKILEELKKPFHPAHVTWKPGSLNEDRTKALALAYADLRAYQNRLDEICGGDWSVTYTPWGDRIVCHLTIHGVTRSSTGEPDTQSERSEIAGTAAEAQAFKRACAMFGLGRYLYNLPNAWVEYDASRKYFTEKAKARLEGIVYQHYRRALQPDDAEETPATEAPAAEGETQANDAPQNGPSQPPAANGEVSELLRRQFDKLGVELYGDQWEQVCQHNVERITEGKTTDRGELNEEQIKKLINGLRNLKRKRNTLPKTNGAHTPVAA